MTANIGTTKPNIVPLSAESQQLLGSIPHNEQQLGHCTMWYESLLLQFSTSIFDSIMLWSHSNCDDDNGNGYHCNVLTDTNNYGVGCWTDCAVQYHNQWGEMAIAVWTCYWRQSLAAERELFPHRASSRMQTKTDNAGELLQLHSQPAYGYVRLSQWMTRDNNYNKYTLCFQLQSELQ